MEQFSAHPKILVIGNDERLAYLLSRYTEQSHCQLISHTVMPYIDDVVDENPAVLIFLSMDSLHATSHHIDTLLAKEIFVIACVSAAEEVLAHESGADACLIHPFTYEEFWAAVSSACPSEVD
jgi:DNA-binding response OmpR family regulator